MMNLNTIKTRKLSLYYREKACFWLSKFFRGFRQKFGGQLWGREKIKAKN